MWMLLRVTPTQGPGHADLKTNLTAQSCAGDKHGGVGCNIKRVVLMLWLISVCAYTMLEVYLKEKVVGSLFIKLPTYLEDSAGFHTTVRSAVMLLCFMCCRVLFFKKKWSQRGDYKLFLVNIRKHYVQMLIFLEIGQYQPLHYFYYY